LESLGILGIENRNFFLSFQAGNNYLKINLKNNYLFIVRAAASARTADCVRQLASVRRWILSALTRVFSSQVTS
jgi:hypothetical protein